MKEYLPRIYVLLATLAFSYFVIMQLFVPRKSEFSGVYIMILTLPWSIAYSVLSEWLHIQNVALSVVILGIGAIVNYLLLKKLSNA